MWMMDEKNFVINIIKIANAMELKLKIARWFLYLAILLLPWQMRWFSSGPIIGGYPWEQGSLSIYLSWLPMMIVIMVAMIDAVGARFPRPVPGSLPPGSQDQGRVTLPLPIIAVILFLLPFIFSVYPRASFQWLVEILLLILFFISLQTLHVSRFMIMRWFAISLIPHALLGLWQFHTQNVFGSKWLGMATQNPLTAGVSVIEYAGQRILRAYGGFPHPNIFGGWLAIALPVTLLLVQHAKRSIAKFAWMICGVLFSVALVLTFSRSAWITAGVGLMFVALLFLRRQESWTNKIPACAGMTVIFIALALTTFHERALIAPRVDATVRLEQKSLDERAVGWRNGWQLFRQHPFFGVGPGATAHALNSQLIPHNVPLLALDELGIVGMIGLLSIVYWIFCIQYKKYSILNTSYSILCALLILSLFDHYLWSLWSGRVLLILTLFLFWSIYPPYGGIDSWEK
ncbi:O-antigen ligase domain-containing protein [Candidatus Uhrbacteria bacterium]|nr:O-antigen ligase domain-containing protein [Candidatus Uhrbacteria bacterium]